MKFGSFLSFLPKGQMLIDDATTLRYCPNSAGATDLLRGCSVYGYDQAGQRGEAFASPAILPFDKSPSPDHSAQHIFTFPG